MRRRLPRSSFAPEPFACGLAGETADDDAQLLIMTIRAPRSAVFRVEVVDGASLEI